MLLEAVLVTETSYRKCCIYRHVDRKIEGGAGAFMVEADHPVHVPAQFERLERRRYVGVEREQELRDAVCSNQKDI